ncbi:hypothetical protein CKO15_09945 [Halorhodospira abdelmalekii]|uniref:Mur ligase family protein n=1 Tax=Halorhodospira abdelmalekii TaxID=421629 RepID=UPI001A92EFC7|nr:UDP-N-acetylmuramoyl-L-alanyl-D-glutamate--2,6-diaminopimelate ligase [Halorhodospira abdelmalekii]MBK1735600.1 hypothetical protein [Halorhodospira abdelmalekii]
MQSAPAVTLAQLLAPWSAGATAEGSEGGDTGAALCPISGVCSDSRHAAPGMLFAALAGGDRHGLAYAEAALAAGVVAIVWEPVAADSPEHATVDRLAARVAEQARRRGVPMRPVVRLSECIGRLAARCYGEPSHALTVVAVTGTDGKSSVAHFVAQLLGETPLTSAAPAPWGVIGTLGYGGLRQLQPSPLTTPDAARLQAMLAELRAAGCTGVALEASSHALAQGRLQGTAVDVAVLTHLGRDHLDYHGSLDAYAAAKRRLFERPELRARVLNLDDALGRQLAASAPGPVVTYSVVDGASRDMARDTARDTASDMASDNASTMARASRMASGAANGASAVTDACMADPAELAELADLRAQVSPSRPGDRGLALTVLTKSLQQRIEVPLLGRFQAANLLAAIATGVALGYPLKALLSRLPRLQAVPGRLEPFGGGEQPLVIVDYAHTPGALEQALRAAREHCAGRLYVVFGCGGERDTGKRPLMGAIAARNADVVVITDDNPRREEAAAIRTEIAAGCTAVTPQLIAGRGEAIEWAITQAERGDVVLIAGKGHEQVQEIDGLRRPFSDREWVERLLAAVGREA